MVPVSFKGRTGAGVTIASALDGVGLCLQLGSGYGYDGRLLLDHGDIFGKRRGDELEFQHGRIQTAEEITTEVQHSVNPDAISRQILCNQPPSPSSN